jgi:osmoprotectant transport system substrate-binding protein
MQRPGPEPTRQRRRRSRLPVIAVALLALMGVVLAACGSDSKSSGSSSSTVPNGPKITLGAQDFPESVVLSAVYSQAFQNAGYNSGVQELGGYRDLLYGAFATGDVNFAVEYAASMYNYLAKPDSPAGTDVTANVEGATPLLQAKGITIAEPSDAIDTNAFVMTKARSEELGITSLSDLAAKGSSLKLGGPSDCETNAFCIPGLQRAYGLNMSSNFVALDSGVADALAGNQFDVGVLFSTDPPVTDDKFVVLKDDKAMLAADNIVPVMSQSLVDAYGEDFVALVNKVSAALTTENVAAMNKAYIVDREDASAIASKFLADNGLD